MTTQICCYEQSYFIKEIEEGLLKENLSLWLIVGFIDDFKKTEFGDDVEFPLEIQKMIAAFYGVLWKQKKIKFDRTVKEIDFITDSWIKITRPKLYTVLTNQKISPQISNKWRVKYAIKSVDIGCYIGYALENGIKHDEHPLGRGRNGVTSTGILINRYKNSFSLYDNGKKKILQYPNQQITQQNDEFEFIYDLENNKIRITHNDKNSLEISINPLHHNKALIPAVSLWKGREIEILCLKYE
eukprot:71368_1